MCKHCARGKNLNSVSLCCLRKTEVRKPTWFMYGSCHHWRAVVSYLQMNFVVHFIINQLFVPVFSSLPFAHSFVGQSYDFPVVCFATFCNNVSVYSGRCWVNFANASLRE